MSFVDKQKIVRLYIPTVILLGKLQETSQLVKN